jgi:hypothetical protein
VERPKATLIALRRFIIARNESIRPVSMPAVPDIGAELLVFDSNALKRGKRHDCEKGRPASLSGRGVEQ